ncbi:hypothetical protein [Streptomyces sp. NBC_01187]|uniref:hypothetical protein n=1 Tax=Streptomyces sp. NBC_01187 TaxID=2903766 RepID=UPI00386B1601|nr:hypothetical protein OG220_11750 [Streptomyces sp. NBC_01187]
MSGSTWWIGDAPCVGDLRFAPTEATEETVRDSRDLLTVCQGCPFRAQCIGLVQPRHSRFDGICGGRLWLDGEIRTTCKNARSGELVEGPAPITHGTEAGARAHNRRGERACDLCREAGRIAQARRRAQKKRIAKEPSKQRRAKKRT